MNLVILCKHLILLVVFNIIRVKSDEHDHKYGDNEEVIVWMNTVGPYHNRQETYEYYSLPFCKGDKTTISHYHETLGEALQGVELEFSGLDVLYKKDQPLVKFC